MKTETSFENGVLTVARHYDAPRAEVFDAWIDTSQVQLWWGCGFTERVEAEIEPKVGGAFNVCMYGKAYGELKPQGRITSYEPPALLAYELVEPMADGPVTWVEVKFEEAGEGTRVVLKHHGLAAELVQYVGPGWTSAFERLADVKAGIVERAA